jgi:thiol-disulfide isomerase/thioredoxin
MAFKISNPFKKKTSTKVTGGDSTKVQAGYSGPSFGPTTTTITASTPQSGTLVTTTSGSAKDMVKATRSSGGGGGGSSSLPQSTVSSADLDKKIQEQQAEITKQNLAKINTGLKILTGGFNKLDLNKKENTLEALKVGSVLPNVKNIFTNAIRDMERFQEDRPNIDKRIKQNIEKKQEEFPDVKFFKVDTEECDRLTNIYQVRALPTVLVFKNGKEEERIVGFSAPTVEAAIRKVIG